MKNNYLVFTDLDGTLLDHDDYSFSAAKDALELLRAKSIPLIIATSKTFSEVVGLQKELEIREPFIVENGAGIFIPEECVLTNELPFKEDWIKVSKAQSYIELRLFFAEIKRDYPVKGFGDMTPEEVMDLTGLSAIEAINAMKRDFTEPFVLEDHSFAPKIKQAANAEGLDIIQGGRFYHLVSLHQDKANAMLTLSHMYEEYHDKKFTKIALGDSANDFTMIRTADVGVLVPLYDGSFSAIGEGDITKAKYPGPKGWNSFMLEYFNGQ